MKKPRAPKLQPKFPVGTQARIVESTYKDPAYQSGTVVEVVHAYPRQDHYICKSGGAKTNCLFKSEQLVMIHALPPMPMPAAQQGVVF